MDSTLTSLAKDSELYTKLSKNQEVKMVQGEVPFNKDLTLIDVSLRAKGPREDRTFAKSDFLRKNIRRGLSFLKENDKEPYLCRKGLEKFFDMKHEYIEILRGSSLDKRRYKITKDEESLYHAIFDEVKEVLSKGGKVTVYKTEKANGENAQVSYNPTYGAWVIASKNVSILVRDVEDIEEYAKYTLQRYSFALLIADVWLKLIKNVKNLEALKKDLTGKTIIGEYCGNPMYQHLVKYESITIYFFALVELNSERTCVPMQTAQDFFTKHNLPMVKVTPRKECNNMDDLVGIMLELSKEVAENTIEEDQEGSVVYFEAKLMDKTEILSLTKVKTLEYRLYRKLREKLKTIVRKGTAVKKQISTYEKEVEALCEEYKPAKPINHYFEVARLAINFVGEHRKDIGDKLGLSNRYLDFLNIVRELHSTGTKPEVHHFQKLIETADEASEGSDLEEEDDEQGDNSKDKKEPQEETKSREVKKGKKEEGKTSDKDDYKKKKNGKNIKEEIGEKVDNVVEKGKGNKAKREEVEPNPSKKKNQKIIDKSETE